MYEESPPWKSVPSIAEQHIPDGQVLADILIPKLRPRYVAD